jgi:hypothetical protein
LIGTISSLILLFGACNEIAKETGQSRLFKKF